MGKLRQLGVGTGLMTKCLILAMVILLVEGQTSPIPDPDITTEPAPGPDGGGTTPPPPAPTGDPKPLIITGFTLDDDGHRITSGTVTLTDKRTISIKNFWYDGGGPAAMFSYDKVKMSQQSPRLNTTKYQDKPLQGKGPKEGEYVGYDGEDVEVTLPADVTWEEVAEFGVWCFQAERAFAKLRIPKNLNLPDAKP